MDSFKSFGIRVFISGGFKLGELSLSLSYKYDRRQEVKGIIF